MRHALLIGLVVAACDVATPRAVERLAAIDAPHVLQEPAAAPAPCWPVPQAFALAQLTAARLPASRRSYGRRSSARNLVEIAAHPSRSDSARVVIDGHVFDDVREPATLRRLVRWMNALHFESPSGWELVPRGWVVAADASVDAAIVADVAALASGRRLEDPVDVALRMPGTTAITTQPVRIGEHGIAPGVGSWGEWAATIDAADAQQPVVLELPDADGMWELRNELPPATTTLRIDAVAPARARESVARHRNELRACYLQAIMRDPDLAGTWSIAIADDRSVGVAPATDPFALCAARAARRWRLASVDVTVSGSVVH